MIESITIFIFFLIYVYILQTQYREHILFPNLEKKIFLKTVFQHPSSIVAKVLLQFKCVFSLTVFRGNREKFQFSNNMPSFLKDLKWVSIKFSLPMKFLVFYENVSFYFWLHFERVKNMEFFRSISSSLTTAK